MYLFNRYATQRIVLKNMEIIEASHSSVEPARNAKTRERVLAAASRILKEDGYSRLTMERVAAESGAAKTTVYRSWPTKAALCMDLYLNVARRELHDPDTGNIADDLKHIANTVVRLQTRTVAGQAFIGLIAEAQLNPSTKEAFLAEFADRRREVTRHVLRRAIVRGEVKPEIDIDLVIDALGGATTFRLLQGHAPLTAKFVDKLVTLILYGCNASASSRRKSSRSSTRR